MTISAVFKSPMPSMSYLYKNGMSATFINGRYITDVEWQIAELAAEVGELGKHKSKHPYIYVDETEKEIDSEALSPIELIKLKAKEEARTELLAEQAEAQARALNSAANVSTTKANDFAQSLGNSNTIAQAGTAESTGSNDATVTATGSMGAKLTSLSAGLKTK